MPKPRKVTPINRKLDTSLNSYVAAAAAAAAGAGFLALAPAAEAKVIYTATYTNVTAGYFIDLNHDGTHDGEFLNRGECATTDGGLFCSVSDQFIGSVVGTGASSNARVTALRAGAQIGPAENFVLYGNLAAVGFRRPGSGTIETDANWTGNFANGGHGVRDAYLGIKFKIGGQVHYGWARVSVEIPNQGQPKNSIFLTGYAYETEANTPIIAGQESGPSRISSSQQPTENVDASASLGALARGADALPTRKRIAEQ